VRLGHNHLSYGMAAMLEQFCFVISVIGLDRPRNGDDDDDSYELIMLVFL
jgi:hypothetical protein